MMEKKETISGTIRKHFFTGLFVLAPLFITLWVVLFIIENLDAIVPEALNSLGGRRIPGLGIVVFVGILVLVGITARFLFFRKILAINEKILSKVPVAGAVYQGTKQILSAMSLENAGAFRRVVLIEFPSPGIYSYAFVTGEPAKEVETLTGKKMISVFMPTTPNPTTGFLMLVEEKNTVALKLSVSDALSTIISAGIVKNNKDAALHLPIQI